ncbi:hypothetical protein [Streptomyces yerevanensis]|uniref:hypothetical protein n=1 Tax=Streptomyces yerevanensis TaxID=66378 RepID=UPI0005261106|nr:hypothetical protein [Streptomyces yerevanensis]
MDQSIAVTGADVPVVSGTPKRLSDHASLWQAVCGDASHQPTKRGAVEFGLLGEQVAGFGEERAGGVEDGAGDPGVEVVRSGGVSPWVACCGTTGRGPGMLKP